MTMRWSIFSRSGRNGAADQQRDGSGDAAVDFCIEWRSESAGPCVLCDSATGTGPVGWHKTDPIGPVCDTCMISAYRSLGAVLMTVNVIREIAATRVEDRSAQNRKVIGILTYASRYHKTESATWPFRGFGFLEALDELDRRYRPRGTG